MTNAIEQTKREMYKRLAQMKETASYGLAPSLSLQEFEIALEAHLEELRKALVAVNSSTVACAQHSAEAFIEMEGRLAKMTNERDAIQLRLHAVDHAYSESQKAVGNQMSVIASLQDRLAINEREKREEGTSGSACGDRGSSAKLDGDMATVIAAVRSAQDIMVEYLVPDGIRAKRAMTKLIPLLDNEKLYSALYELEHAEGSK